MYLLFLILAIRQLAESRHGNEELADTREELEAVASRLSLATTELEDFRQTNGLLNAQVRLLMGRWWGRGWGENFVEGMREKDG